MLSLQILWSEKCDGALAKVASSGSAADMSPVQGVLDSVQNMLNVLADSVLHEQPPVRRKKLEHLVRNFVTLVNTQPGGAVIPGNASLISYWVQLKGIKMQYCPHLCHLIKICTTVIFSQLQWQEGIGCLLTYHLDCY